MSPRHPLRGLQKKLLIEWVAAIIVAPLCGWTGYLSRALVPRRALMPPRGMRTATTERAMETAAEPESTAA